jgi:hypothetical protein
MDVQVTKEAFSSQKRTSSTSKHEIFYFFCYFCGSFCGSGSTDSIEKGSATLHQGSEAHGDGEGAPADAPRSGAEDLREPLRDAGPGGGLQGEGQQVLDLGSAGLFGRGADRHDLCAQVGSLQIFLNLHVKRLFTLCFILAFSLLFVLSPHSFSYKNAVLQIQIWDPGCGAFFEPWIRMGKK